eukprot:CAMPEP_0114130202 /NCGR_PEP_ID=MMETSP0043_2-20121206/11889_1 /TAXON_ID=464988 /ORGANISM="Hemiselmis andersenii, Strain CCMP644" /LENGTH=254 /DNA_ID=CAMNT_0001223541 /DNA_START=21 /DNA_END=785 /DNA_ORIENTATION=-
MAPSFFGNDARMQAGMPSMPLHHAQGGPGDVQSRVEQPREQRFSPYANNGGTCLAVAGDDFCIVAADSRLSQGYSIMSRTTSKISQLTDQCCIASSGCNSDQVTLHKLLKFRIKMYRHQHEKMMSAPAVGQMLATTLYGRRFFPYYTFNVVGGLDEKGEGCVFSYDAIGCFERLKYTASGTGQALIEPFLDNLVAYKNTDNKPTVSRSAEETLELVKDIFASAGERDIYTGDFVDIYVIKKDGTTYEQFALKKD